MKARSKNCCCYRKWPGLTLVEVVAAIALMGSLLSVTLVAHSRHSRQVSLAKKRHAAIAEMDRLMVAWNMPGRRIPIGRSSTVNGTPDFLWRTTRIRSASAKALLCDVIEVGIYETDINEASENPLCSLQVLIPAEVARQ